jgi:transcriptional regulator with XRE-family HTH domain
MTQAELARKSGVSTGGISDILTGRRDPGATMARKIAEALEIPAEEAYRAAGLLSDEPERTREVEQIIHIVEGMPPEEQKEVLSYIRWRNNQKKK